MVGCQACLAVLLAVLPQAQDPLVGGYVAKFEDGSSAFAAAFGQELLRIRPDGKFEMYRLQIEGTWTHAGDTLVLTPTKFHDESVGAFKAMIASHTKELGDEAKPLVDVISGALTAPFTLTVTPEGQLHQGASLRSLEEFDWVRRKDPPLLEQLTEMGKQGDDLDYSLYAYNFDGIQDNVEALTPQLISILDSDADWSPRDWAATMLGYSKQPEATQALMRHIEGDQRVVMLSAQEGLMQIADPSVLPQLIELNSKGVVRYRTVAYLIKNAKAATYIPVLVDGLGHESKYDRQQSLEALAVMPRDAHLPAGTIEKVMAMLTKDSDAGVRANAATVVSKWSNSEADRDAALQTLVGLIDTPEWLDRAAVVDGLGDCGFRAVRYLVEFLTDPEWSIRRNAARALGKIGMPAALPALQKAFKDEDNSYARDAMYTAIQNLKGKD